MATTQLIESYTRRTNFSGETQPLREMTPMLLVGALSKITQALDAHRLGQFSVCGFHIGRATAIIDALRNDLNIEENGKTAKCYEDFYSLIDDCLQNAVHEETEKWLAMAEDAVTRASSFWTFSSDAYHGLSGNA